MYKALFEGASDAIFLMKKEKFIKCNRKTLEMFGCDGYEDIIGKEPWIFSPEYQPDGQASKEKAQQFINEALDGQPQRFYWTHTRKNGSTFNAEVSLSRIDIDNKTIIQAIVRDISELKKAYKRVELYRDLFTHDINNILQGNLSGLQLIETYYEKDIIKGDKLLSIVNLLKNQINRGAKLVSNIRKLSKLEEYNQVEKHLKPIDSLKILKKVLKRVKSKYSEGNIEINFPSALDRACVKADLYLEDIFENILLNAIQHNERGFVEIDIHISKEIRYGMKDFIQFTFIDNARGIEPSQKKMIFLRDYKNTEKNENLYGLGLGLTLVKRIIDYYGGEIWVENKVPRDYTQGSKFHIIIPEVKNIDNLL